MLLHVSAIASGVNLPVSADLENGFGDDPETVADTIRLAAAAGARRRIDRRRDREPGLSAL